MKRKIIQGILAIAAIFLAFKIYQSIMEPIEFNKKQSERYGAAIDRLKDIRTVQQAYKAIYGRYMADWDSLILFAQTDSFEITKIIGSYDMDKYTEKQAIKAGVVKVEKFKVSVLDSLFGKKYAIDSLKYIPYTNGKIFNLDAGKLETGSMIAINVFEASVPDTVLLDGLPEQLVYNYTDERWRKTGYPGLKVGSMTEPTNDAGNWE